MGRALRVAARLRIRRHLGVVKHGAVSKTSVEEFSLRLGE